MSNKIITYSSHRPCPVCLKGSANCRSFAENDIVLCMTLGTQSKGYVQNGYKVIGITKDSLWAIAKPTEDESSPSTFIPKKKESLPRVVVTLPIHERDRQYRLLAGSNPLLTRHKEKLINVRGLRREEIDFAAEHFLLMTWSQGQRVSGSISPSLPGVRRDDSSLTMGGMSGIAIAATLADGSVTGYQIAPDDFTLTNNVPKYLWLSSSSSEGSKPNLPGGELPLFVRRYPGVRADEITETWLVEGGLKSLIVALKLWNRFGRTDIQVIGAAGGQFVGSPNLLRESVLGKLILMPDAGAVINANVMNQYKKVFAFMEVNSTEVRFGWWGQDKKHHKDIDEIEDIFPGTVSGKEFFAYQPIENQPIYKPNLQWLEYTKLTPDRSVNQEFLGDLSEYIGNAKILAVKSGLGSGKTESLFRLMKSSPEDRFIFLGYRNNLLLQIISRAQKHGVSIYHYQDENGKMMLADKHSHISACIDSISHLKGIFSGSTIIIDEVVSVLQHAFEGGTLGGKHAAVLSQLKDALSECKQIILLDANLSDSAVRLIEKLSDKDSFVIENTAKGKPHNFIFSDYITKKGELSVKGDPTGLVKGLLRKDCRPWIVSDSKKYTDRL